MTTSSDPSDADGPRRDAGVTLRPEPRTLGQLGWILTVASGVAIAALLVLTGLGRGLRAPPSWLIVGVTLLPYLYGAVIAWLFTLWIFAPDRTSIPILLTLVSLILVALWGPSWAARPQEGEGASLTMMNWNLRRLWGGGQDGGDALGCVIQAVQERDPDVLALLEVSLDDIEALTEPLQLECAHATYLAGGGPTKGGLAVCARGERWSLRSGSGQRFVDPDDWHYVFAELQAASGQVFNALAVHLHPYEFSMNRWMDLGRHGQRVQRAQSDQAIALLHRMGRLKDPTLVAGDFNSTRDAALHVGLRRHLTDTWERAGLGLGGTVDLFGWLPLRVDYVYASEQFAVRSAEVSGEGCSDHRAVVSGLVLA